MLFTYSAEFVDCRFVGKVIECNFFGTIPDLARSKQVGRTANEFRGNDFTEADLVWVGFHGVDLQAQRWPESDEYAILTEPQHRIQVAIERARAGLTGEQLDRVLSELDLLAGYHDEERQVLVRRTEIGWGRRLPFSSGSGTT